jgi:hypothetical protein
MAGMKSPVKVLGHQLGAFDICDALCDYVGAAGWVADWQPIDEGKIFPKALI